MEEQQRMTAEEKQRTVSPVNETQTEVPPNNFGKKSNKWKNRLAKIKGSKQDSSKASQEDIKPEKLSVLPDRGQMLVDFKSSEATSDPSDNLHKGQILVDSKRPQNASAETLESTDFKNQSIEGAPKPPNNLPKPTDSVTSKTNPHHGTTDIAKEDVLHSKNSNESKNQDSKIQHNLRKSFDVFDAFLQKV